jgi:hypothetical protein
MTTPRNDNKPLAVPPSRVVIASMLLSGSEIPRADGCRDGRGRRQRRRTFPWLWGDDGGIG